MNTWTSLLLRESSGNKYLKKKKLTKSKSKSSRNKHLRRKNNSPSPSPRGLEVLWLPLAVSRLSLNNHLFIFLSNSIYFLTLFLSITIYFLSCSKFAMFSYFLVIPNCLLSHLMSSHLFAYLPFELSYFKGMMMTTMMTIMMTMMMVMICLHTFHLHCRTSRERNSRRCHNPYCHCYVAGKLSKDYKLLQSYNFGAVHERRHPLRGGGRVFMSISVLWWVLVGALTLVSLVCMGEYLGCIGGCLGIIGQFLVGCFGIWS